MQYFKCLWIQDNPDYPTLLYSELDDARWETRKVDIFGDGKMEYASDTEETGSTYLSEVPIPLLSEIAADPQFKPSEISKDEFEEIWAKAKAAWTGPIRTPPPVPTKK